MSSTVEEGQRILRTSRRLAIVLGISGASIAAALVAYASWFGDTAGSRRAESPRKHGFENRAKSAGGDQGEPFDFPPCRSAIVPVGGSHRSPRGSCRSGGDGYWRHRQFAIPIHQRTRGQCRHSAGSSNRCPLGVTNFSTLSLAIHDPLYGEVGRLRSCRSQGSTFGIIIPTTPK